MNLRREMPNADARDFVIVILPLLPLEKRGALMRDILGPPARHCHHVRRRNEVKALADFVIGSDRMEHFRELTSPPPLRGRVDRAER
jgi:hypothetical protein